jgi:hypothetical protein
MKKELRLFVWTGFNPDYSGGLAFAIAETEVQARLLIKKKFRSENWNLKPRSWGTLQILPLDAEVARYVSGGS